MNSDLHLIDKLLAFRFTHVPLESTFLKPKFFNFSVSIYVQSSPYGN